MEKRLTKADVERLKDKIMEGNMLSDDEIYALADGAQSTHLRQAAAEITAKFIPRNFDSCSIINARSGRCPEDCKWCAQSAHYETGCTSYPLVSEEDFAKAARLNKKHDIKRFSPVASGRRMRGKALLALTDMIRHAKAETGLYFCASLGLMGREELQELWDAGVRRYHCNLETAPSYFATLCTTHSQADKLKTIELAREIGFDICSGGIIGMGESRRQRAEFALALRQTQPVSIPINILCPIAGTPLENEPPIAEDELLDTVAIFRFAHPHAVLRFAGGRANLPCHVQLEAMRIGVTGAIMGDMLTTIGSTIAADKEMVAEAGLEF